MGIMTSIFANKVDGLLSDNLVDKIIACYERAEKDFYNKYGDKYGNSLSSFLVRQENIEVIEKSFYFSNTPLKPEDFNLTSFDGYDNPTKEAVIDFINMLILRVHEDFELSKLLAEKEHIYETKNEHQVIMSKIEDLSSNMIKKEDLQKLLNEFKKINRRIEFNMETQENSFFSTDIKEMLKENCIDIVEQNITSIFNEDGKVKGELIVKYDDFLSKFRNFQQLLNYSYYTQTVIELEPIAFKLYLEGILIKEIIYDKEYTGKVAKINFASYGEVRVITEKFKANEEADKVVSKFVIHPPQRIENAFKVNIESEDFDTILPNIDLKVENRKFIAENHLIATLSNVGQKDSNIYIKFDVEIRQNKVLNTNIQIQPMDKKSALDNLKWLKTIKFLKSVKKILARDCEDKRILFEGNINLNNGGENIEEHIDLLKKILFIEKEFGVTFDISNEIDYETIKDIENLINILKTGKIEMPDFILTINFEANSKYDKLKENEIYMFQLSTSDKYKIFNKELDLGDQVILLEKVKLKNINEDGLTLETQKESKKIRIYKRYYGDYSLQQIKEREGF